MRHSFLIALVVCFSGMASWQLRADAIEVAVLQDGAAPQAEAEKAADAQKAADEKAADEKRAAEEKATDEKKAAEEKAADEKAAAEKKAVEEKAAAEKKAADKKAAADKAAAEKKAADDKAAAEKAAAEKKAAEEKKKEKKIHSLATFDLDIDLTEGPGQGGLFAELAPSLHKVIERIEKAGKDDKIQGIVLKLDSPGMGRGKIEELRGALLRARKAGKKVYALVDEVSNGDYLLATACDEIIMPASGTVSISGVRAEVTFYKDLLDKLGVKADMLQVGDFKGAAEPFTRSDMSPEFRQQFESLIDDVYQQMVETIAADRKLDRHRVRELIDEGLFTAAEAKEKGLIDRVAYEDEFRATLKEQSKADEVKLVKDYGKQKVDADFSGLGGFMKLMDMMAGREPREKSGKNKKIAVVYAVGVIMPGDSATGLFGSALGGDTLVKALRDAEEDDKVAAIVLRVNSPGGSALASDLVWREVTRIKKPIVASMGDMAASGGYYISMGADKIVAEPATLTGSIGVVGGKLALGGLMKKAGVNTEVVSRGKNSGWESIDRPFTESERAAWLKIMQDIYKQFTTKAAEGRKMELSKLEELAQGKLYTGRQAVEKKLVDQVGTLEDAIAEARKLAGIAESETIDRVILPKPKSLFEELFEGPSVEADAAIPNVLSAQLKSQLASVIPGLGEFLDEAALFPRLFREPGVTVMPYRVRIR